VPRPRKYDSHRHVGFRMLQEHFDVLAAYAASRGVDLSAVLNECVAERLPVMLAWQRRTERAAAPALAAPVREYGAADEVE